MPGSTHRARHKRAFEAGSLDHGSKTIFVFSVLTLAVSGRRQRIAVAALAAIAIGRRARSGEERDLSERLVSWGTATIRSMSVDPIRPDPERPAKGGFPRWLYFWATFGTLLIGLGVAGLVLFLDTSLVDALGAGVNAALLLVAVLALVFAKSQVDAASEANRLSHAAQLAAAHA